MRRKFLATACMLAVLPAAAFAQSAQPSPEMAEARDKVRAACAADVQKFCANVERGTGKGEMRACMKTNEAQLSDACKAARAERSALRAKEKS